MSDTLFSATDYNLQTFSPLQLRLKLLEQGYAPIACVGKKPIADNWQSGVVTPERLRAEAAAFALATNIGLRTDDFSVVDIDLWNDDHVGDVGALVAEHLGLTPLIRRGRKGLAMCYRLVGDPIGKLYVKENTGKRSKPTQFCPNGNPIYGTLVEILGKTNQVVGYGIHPDTGLPYEWIGDREPLLTKWSDLPAVMPGQLRQLAEAIRVLCGDLGYKVKGVSVEGGEYRDRPAPTPGRPDHALDVTKMFLRLIPTVRLSPSGYYNFRCPVCRKSGAKAGIQPLTNGGFYFKCFHASCEFAKPTGWQPPPRRVGERVKYLYECLGGDRSDFNLVEMLEGYDSMTELLAELYQ